MSRFLDELEGQPEATWDPGTGMFRLPEGIVTTEGERTTWAAGGYHEPARPYYPRCVVCGRPVGVDHVDPATGVYECGR